MLGSKPVKFDIPHEPGQWMELKTLSWKKLKKARKALEKDHIETMRAFGAELVGALRDGATEKNLRQLEKRQQYHLSAFDIETLLFHGIATWSYDAEINAETIAELDERTATWAAETIIELTKPPDEDEQKKS
jgi:hypothetical protein